MIPEQVLHLYLLSDSVWDDCHAIAIRAAGSAFDIKADVRGLAACGQRPFQDQTTLHLAGQGLRMEQV